MPRGAWLRAAQLVTLAVIVMQMCMCRGGTHLPATGLSFAQLTPSQAADELRECLAKYNSSVQDSPHVKSPWAGWLLQNDTAPVVAGPLIPKAGSTFLRVLFGAQNRPKALTTMAEFLRLRGEQPQSSNKFMSQHNTSVDPASAQLQASKFWFAIVRDPLTRFVDAYVQIANNINAGARSGCDFDHTWTATCVVAIAAAVVVAKFAGIVAGAGGSGGGSGGRRRWWWRC
jgi:hypothetical protein